jgi:hypothetical protein
MEEDYAQIAAKLKEAEPLKLKHWRQHDLVRWLRDGSRCVYCGKDMLESYATAYYNYTYDHLLPRSVYPELEGIDWNNLLSCCACNSIKNAWNPNVQSRLPEIYSAGSGTITPEGIAELLQRAKSYVNQKRIELDARFEEEQQVLRGVLQSLHSSAAASGGT